MPFDEVVLKIGEFVSNPESVAAGAADLIEALRAEYETHAAATAKIAEQETKIRALQDSNAQLFLRVTGSPATAEPETPSPDEALNSLFTKEKEN